MSFNDSLLKKSTGQNFGASGDYITPGTHAIRVDKLEFFESKDSGAPTFLINGTVIKSEAGTFKWELVNGKPEQCVPKVSPPLKLGSRITWMQVSKAEQAKVFTDRVGNFCAAVKQAFIMDLGAAPGDDSRNAYIDQKWKSAEERTRVRGFYNSGVKNPTVTEGNDILDIVDCKLPEGLILKVFAKDKTNRPGTKIIFETEWSVWPADQVAKLTKIAQDIDAGKFGDDDEE